AMSKSEIIIESDDVKLQVFPGLRSIITYPSNAGVSFNDKPVQTANGTKGDGGYQSEFLQILTSGWDYKNHGDGYWYDRDGNRLSAPENLEPLPNAFIGPDPLGMLQAWQQNHPYYHNQVFVDGQAPENKQGLPGDPALPGAYFSSNAN